MEEKKRNIDKNAIGCLSACASLSIPQAVSKYTKIKIKIMKKKAIK